ncbi:MAG: hypothetical protein MJB14_10270 [Spirochaetes bacterium]|nr:hypothetical protein [Spirochaetota bacterium]
MRLGIDLDMTLVDFNPVYQEAFDYYGMEYEKPKTWGMFDYPRFIRKRIFKSFSNSKIMCSLHPYDDSHPFINHMRHLGHQVIIITARDPKMNNEHFINSLFQVDDIIVTQPGKSKQKILKEKAIDIWIDDCPDQVIETYQSGIETIMIQNNDTLYNQHINHIPRINRLSDLLVNIPELVN